jgi:hypothetical protein
MPLGVRLFDLISRVFEHFEDTFKFYLINLAKDIQCYLQGKILIL